MTRSLRHAVNTWRRFFVCACAHAGQSRPKPPRGLFCSFRGHTRAAQATTHNSPASHRRCPGCRCAGRCRCRCPSGCRSLQARVKTANFQVLRTLHSAQSLRAGLLRVSFTSCRAERPYQARCAQPEGTPANSRPEGCRPQTSDAGAAQNEHRHGSMLTQRANLFVDGSHQPVKEAGVECLGQSVARLGSRNCEQAGGSRERWARRRAGGRAAMSETVGNARAHACSCLLPTQPTGRRGPAAGSHLSHTP